MIFRKKTVDAVSRAFATAAHEILVNAVQDKALKSLLGRGRKCEILVRPVRGGADTAALAVQRFDVVVVPEGFKAPRRVGSFTAMLFPRAAILTYMKKAALPFAGGKEMGSLVIDSDMVAPNKILRKHELDLFAVELSRSVTGAALRQKARAFHM